MRHTTRKRAFGGGRIGLLPTPAHKLFAVLVYLKVYPTYDVLGFLLRLDRTRCFRWIQFLLPVLTKTLRRKLMLPKRQIRSIEEFFREFPEAKDVFIDGTERILILTPTKSGRRHDKRLFDKAVGGENIPSSITVWVDTGFQGIQNDHRNTEIPKKAKRNHP